MLNLNGSKLICYPPTAGITGTNGLMCFDTKGYDYANIYVMTGTHATNGEEPFVSLAVKESDTAVTNATAASAITALAGSTSTTSGFTMSGVATSGRGGVATEFQLDLKKRKRFVGLEWECQSQATATMCILAVLSRGEESKDTAALKRGYNLANGTSATNHNSCQLVVTS